MLAGARATKKSISAKLSGLSALPMPRNTKMKSKEIQSWKTKKCWRRLRNQELSLPNCLGSQCQHFPECQTEPISVRFSPLEVTFNSGKQPMTATQGHPTPTQPSIFCIVSPLNLLMLMLRFMMLWWNTKRIFELFMIRLFYRESRQINFLQSHRLMTNSRGTQ